MHPLNGSITHFTFEDIKLHFFDCKVSNEGAVGTVTITSSINEFKSNEENVLRRVWRFSFCIATASWLKEVEVEVLRKFIRFRKEGESWRRYVLREVQEKGAFRFLLHFLPLIALDVRKRREGWEIVKNKVAYEYRGDVRKRAANSRARHGRCQLYEKYASREPPCCCKQMHAAHFGYIRSC